MFLLFFAILKLYVYFFTAPVSTVLNQNTLQNVAAKSQDPCGYQPPVTNITQVPAASNKEQNLCSSKTTSEPKTKQITKEESIKLAGTFQYATNNSEPAQFSLEDVTVGYAFYFFIKEK